MNVKKLPSLLCLLLAVAVSSTAIYLGFTANTRQPTLLREDKQARQAAEQLVDCLSSGDFQGAGGCLQGVTGLVLPQEGEDAAGLLWRHYRESLSGELIGEVYLDAQGCCQDAVFRGADLDALTRRMRALAPGLLTQRIEQAEDPAEIYNEDLSLREALIDDLLLQAAQMAVEETQKTWECRVRLRLTYADGVWQVQPDPALLEILSGRMENS